MRPRPLGISRAAWLAMLIGSMALFGIHTTHAQVVGSTLSGTVSDTSGAAIPAAQLSIKNVATGIVREVVTDNSGFYTVPNLAPGGYEVTIKANGFATQIRSGLTLTVGAQQQLNASLQIGQVNQTVRVTGEAPQIQTTSSEMSAVVEQQQVVELPLNGRSWTDLAVLQRGVSLVQNTMGGAGCQRDCGAEFDIAGARPQQNNYRIDGISVNDQYGSGPGSELGVNLGVDTIQEFSVVTNNYSAEYGKTSGGVINAATRTGTNAIHGSGFGFLRNSALDSRKYFDGATLPPFRRADFGASAGGPIQKDKTFWFGGYEGVRQILSTAVQDIVPSANAHQGLLSTGKVTVNPQIAQALGLYPLPNNGLIGAGDTGLFTFNSNQIIHEDYANGRIDRVLTMQDGLAGTFQYDRSASSAPDNFENLLLGNSTKRYYVTLSETHTFSSSMANTARVGYTRFDNFQATQLALLNPAAANPSLATVPGKGGMAQISISGCSCSSNPGGVGSNLTGTSYFNTTQAYDDLFITKGLHSFKVGAAFERDRQNYINSTQPGGVWAFGSLANFLQNIPASLQAQQPASLTPRHITQNIVGGYFQDDWRFRPSLTLNLGLRYEMATVPYEEDGKISNLINLTDATPRIGNPWFENPTRRGFQPRVGFAWDPFKKGTTSVRGGFGVFEVLPLYLELTSQGAQSEPFFLLSQGTSLLQGDFPTQGYLRLASAGNSNRVVHVENNPKEDYVMQWNLDVQRQITTTLSFSLGYVGSRGVHQPFHSTEGDIVLPTLTSAGWLFPKPIGSGTRINNNFGNIKTVDWIADSNYNGLALSIEKRLSHGVQIQGAFTWARSLDDDSSTLEGNGFIGSVQAPQTFNYEASLKSLYYGPSDYNVPRTLIINGLWNIPTPEFKSALVAGLLKGWQMGGIFKANDGPPFTPTWCSAGNCDGSNASINTGYVDRVPCSNLVNPGNPVNYVNASCFTLPTAPSMAFWQANCDTTSKIYGASNKTTEPYPLCFNLRGQTNRNILNAPGYIDLDYSLVKNTYVPKISENFDVQFRAETFNIANRVNFNGPQPTSVSTTLPADIFGAGGVPNQALGRLTTTSPARQIQFGLKVIW